MDKYLFIAREKIVGVVDDIGLKALNGYAEIFIEIPDGKDVDDITDEAIKQLNKEYPNHKFEEYEWKNMAQN